MDIREYNRTAWNGLVDQGDRWTVPVSAEVVAAARRGEWEIILTPHRPVPRSWFPPLAGTRILCLAGAGGQQGPVLAAAGGIVTVYDNSPKQLAQDSFVAARDQLALETVEGDMRDLTVFPDGTFDLIVHPCANGFVPDVRPVWKEACRVLRPGGLLLAGFINPVLFIFDEQLAEQGRLEVRHRLPYSDLTSLTEAEREKFLQAGQPLSFSHSLEDQLGGQTDAGLVLTGCYEDIWPGQALADFMPCFLATRALKPTASSTL